MDVVGAPRSRTGRRARARGGWAALTLAGAAAFWAANLLISLTPSAAAYRSALSIEYVPMLVEAAVGGLVLAGLVSLIMLRLGARVPGSGRLHQALFLAACALVLVTVVVEVPAKFGARIQDPGRWLLVATVINTIRILALGLAIGLLARGQDAGAERDGPAATWEEKS
jgi:hypothetical protein